MKLKSVIKDAIWAGNRLSAEYGKSDDPKKRIAESWELSVHKNGVNTIENGEYAGKSLKEFLQSEKFPLLIKFIDAKKNLSVQVHPGDEYAKKYENESGKTEMWYIIDAVPGAKIVYGLNKNYTREDLQEQIDAGKFESCLNYVEVSPGEVYFIPAGLVHAIGEGILIAEIQQNSDTTYRFYDYNRTDENGKTRELHIKQALDVCIKTKTEYKKQEYIQNICNTLIECEYFTVVKVTPQNSIYFKPEDGFYSVICIDGDGEIKNNENPYGIKKGDSYFLPAKTGECEIKKTNGNFTFLLVSEKNINWEVDLKWD